MNKEVPVANRLVQERDQLRNNQRLLHNIVSTKVTYKQNAVFQYKFNQAWTNGEKKIKTSSDWSHKNTWSGVRISKSQDCAGKVTHLEWE